MTSDDPRREVAQSIENAISELAHALGELDRMPSSDRSTIGFVAHAMNNYLSVNDAVLGLLSRTLREYADADVQAWLDGLRHLGTLMQHTAGRLLRTTSPSEFPLKMEYVPLPMLMDRACDYYRPAAQRKHLEITCRFIGDVPPAWADRVAVAVVADNLLSNAVKYSAPNGAIVVQVMPGPGGVVCSVRDHGPGIAPTDQARLFQRGVTLNAVPTGGEPSSGFGLTIAKEFVERMGGKLWVDSEPGRGACFSFRLLYHPADANAV